MLAGWSPAEGRSRMIPVSGLCDRRTKNEERRTEREVRAQEAFPTAGLRGEEARGQAPLVDQRPKAGRTGGQGREAKKERPVEWERMCCLKAGWRRQFQRGAGAPRATGGPNEQADPASGTPGHRDLGKRTSHGLVRKKA